MGTRTLDEAVERAAAFRMLREIEIGEARRIRARLRTPTSDGSVPLDLARVALEQRIAQLVAHARKWNRQLIIAERAVREALFARRRRRWFFHAPAPPRRFMSDAFAGLRDAGAK